MSALLEIKGASHRSTALLEAQANTLAEQKDALEAQQQELARYREHVDNRFTTIDQHVEARFEETIKRIGALETWRYGLMVLWGLVTAVAGAMGLDSVRFVIQWLLHRNDGSGMGGVK